MKRNITDRLLKWKNQTKRKPLVIQGVRQCGKTFTVSEFGRSEFTHFLYFNFEKQPRLRNIFTYDYNCDRILRELAFHAGIDKIEIDQTLIFFDEIQECHEAVTSLKYFCEDFPDMYLVCAGSLLGPAIAHRQMSFPVGKVEFMQMYPMTFDEFLIANDFEKEISLISSYDLTRSLPDDVCARLQHMCRLYYVIGGMPEVVAKWLETHDFEAVDRVQDDILISYANDFGKYLDAKESLRCSWIWDSIPVQLAKENNKFIFSHVKQCKRSAELEDALLWLNKAGLVHQLNLVDNPQLPLSFHQDVTYFKIYMCDIGLLRRKSGVDASTVLNETPLYSTFRGAFTENFVMCQLLAMGIQPYFWRSQNSAEVDFIIESHELVVPVEAKAGFNTRAKSYALFCQRYKPALGIKLSMKNVGDNLTCSTLTYSLPLYTVWRLPDYLA